MATFTLVAWSNPVDGQEQDFAAWYDEQHLRDMVSVAGFKSAQRYRLLRLAPSRFFKQKFLCLYEFEAPDEESARNVVNVLNASSLPLSAALDVGSVHLAVYAATGPEFAKDSSGAISQR